MIVNKQIKYVITTSIGGDIMTNRPLFTVARILSNLYKNSKTIPQKKAKKMGERKSAVDGAHVLHIYSCIWAPEHHYK